jgi:glucan phosphoethanolaminetransferase (alkaline phosphatase superfamily)
MPTTAGRDLFQRRYTSSVAFLVGLLLFFLPFVVIKCNNTPYAENTGLGLAFGTNYKVMAQKDLPDILQNKNHKEVASEEEKGKLYVFALVALLAGVAGLLFSLSRNRTASSVSMFMGILGALCLVVVMFQINSDVRRNSGGNGPVDISNNIRVTANYTVWYFIAIASFLAAAFFNYKRGDIDIHHEVDSPRQADREEIAKPPDGW